MCVLLPTANQLDFLWLLSLACQVFTSAQFVFNQFWQLLVKSNQAVTRGAPIYILVSVMVLIWPYWQYWLSVKWTQKLPICIHHCVIIIFIIIIAKLLHNDCSGHVTCPQFNKPASRDMYLQSHDFLNIAMLNSKQQH